MGIAPSNISSSSIISTLQIQNFEKTKEFIERKIKTDPDFINKPVNQMDDTILHYAAFKKDKQLIIYLA